MPAKTPEPIVEEHEPVPVEEASNERKESDTRERISTRRTSIDVRRSVSGDSWEREFDVNDAPSDRSDADAVAPLAEPIQAESISKLITTTTDTPPSSTQDKAKETEFDDEWESWT